ncbi:hypothetical protein M5D96_004637 [Drosophila gunungcola]|uniref:Uncharacterized protein n=1 Tax=Drosophila gunungcola TaxID=103775 RepID=A0A9P9YUE5_9MUSC|nr:hypothetical protein M5D96_004637 [Drosophila gunungcola]
MWPSPQICSACGNYFLTVANKPAYFMATTRNAHYSCQIFCHFTPSPGQFNGQLVNTQLSEVCVWILCVRELLRLAAKTRMAKNEGVMASREHSPQRRE